MAHENLFKIYIPEPCHEDWDKMTPNTQGAFCKSCAKTVVDFSGKSDREINAFLLENTDKKICGRFKTSQVEDTPRLKIEAPKIQFPGYLFPINYSPVRAFAMALFVVAAVAVAGCSNSNSEINEGGGGYNNEQIMGKSEYIPDTNKINENNITDSSNCQIRLDPPLMGGVSVHQATDTVVRVDTTQNMLLLGEVYTKPDTTKINEQQKTKMGLVKKVESEKKEYLNGDVQYEK